MLSAIYFVPYIDDISQLSSFTPGSKAFKEAISSIKRSAEIPPDDFPEAIKRWSNLQTTAVLIDLIVFIDIILFAIWDKINGIHRFSGTISIIIWLLTGYFFLADGFAVFAQIKINRICRSILQDSVKRLQIKTQSLPSEKIAQAQALYNSKLDLQTFESPSSSNTPCGCFRCKRIFPIRSYIWEYAGIILEDDGSCPECPFCHSEEYIVYGDKESLLTIENLTTLNTLFIEEN